jgi:hypothetical protein
MEGEEREKEEKGFVVRDKRHLFTEEGKQPPDREEKAEKTEADEPGLEEARKEKAEAREQRREEPKEEKKVEEEREVPLPAVTFFNFVFSLSTQALIQLGEIQDPESGKTVKNLSLAKQTIDLIGMLQEKTKGNLTKEEEALVDSALYDLRMRYVKAAG